jgi:hypothetical protein
LRTRIVRFVVQKQLCIVHAEAALGAGFCGVNVKLTMGLARAVSLLGSQSSDYLGGFLQTRQGTGGVEQIGRLRGGGVATPHFPGAR